MKWIIERTYKWIDKSGIFETRISRNQFIKRFLLSTLFYIIFLICVVVFTLTLHFSKTVTHIIALPARAVGWIYIFYIYYTVVARCHDLGKSGWWFWIPFYFITLFVKEGTPYPNKFDNEEELYQQKISNACEYAFNLREQNKNDDEIESLIRQKFKLSKTEIKIVLTNSYI